MIFMKIYLTQTYDFYELRLGIIFLNIYQTLKHESSRDVPLRKKRNPAVKIYMFLLRFVNSNSLKANNGGIVIAI